MPLSLPQFQAKIFKIEGRLYIYDVLRKKKVVLTPEEWVRQHWIHFLPTKGYNQSLMSIEGGVILNGLQKRTDLIVYNNKGEKILIAEFKAPHIKITQKVFEQISNYNSVHKIPLLLVSNGITHIYSKVDFKKNTFRFLEELPNYDNMI